MPQDANAGGRRRRRARWWLLALLCAVAGCGPCSRASQDDPLRQDLEHICEAPLRAVGDDVQDVRQREALMARYIDDHVVTEEARELLASMAKMPAGLRHRALRERALSVGIRECPLADQLSR